MTSMAQILKPNILAADSSVAVTAESKRFPVPPVKVWLVDDNDELRTMIAEVLDHQGGIECVRHFSSPDALLSTLASKLGPDVILLDVQMGDRNGLDAVRPIKSLTRSTRVLMFTTCFNHEWRDRALGDGASDYLLKSETIENVAARIRCLAQEPAPRPRRRLTPSAKHTRSGSWACAQDNKSPHIFSRALGMLRGLWN